ncbi:MAG: hypothetical protein NC412_12920 [Roseburia sp.]|nr:hypothetical protein [Roseburia sp.]MCM1279693.1 hypothetical protein [Robinsoniella sp.]
MGVRSLGYDSDSLDQIICYFMRTILHLQTSGVENLPLENNLAEPWNGFLDIAMEVFLACPPPEIARLVLESEYDTALHCRQISTEVVIGLQLIKEFVWHIHYDKDYYSYLLSTENIWGHCAIEYATLTFYPNLPDNIKEEYHIFELIQHVPETMFRLNDY